MHAFVILKLIEIDPNKIGIYLTEIEFFALLMILVANLIYDYVKQILFSTNEVGFQLGSIVILHIYNICIYYTNVFLFGYIRWHINICIRYFGLLSSWALYSFAVVCFQLAESQEREKKGKKFF